MALENIIDYIPKDRMMTLLLFINDQIICKSINQLKILIFFCMQDYPSIAHLVQKLSENNIQPIFAVTEDFKGVYKVNA